MSIESDALQLAEQAQPLFENSGSSDVDWTPLVRPNLPPLTEYVALLEQIWDSKMLSNFAAFSQEFEAVATERFGSQAHAVVSCDIGLTLAIAAFELPPKAEVLLPSFTFNSTVNAVLWNQLTPRFIDVLPDTYCLDPAAAEAQGSANTGLIIGTHVFGTACDVVALERAASKLDTHLMFDAAQAVGTHVKGRHVTTYGDASVISFSGTKTITSAEGGLATFGSANLAENFSYLRGYGFLNDYTSKFVGLNGKISELHAALGCLSFSSLDDELSARKILSDRYRENLEAIDQIDFQHVPSEIDSTFTYFSIRVRDGSRDELQAWLETKRIQSKSYFRSLHEMDLFKQYATEQLPVTEMLSRDVLCLPLFSDLTLSQIDDICEHISNFFENKT